MRTGAPFGIFASAQIFGIRIFFAGYELLYVQMLSHRNHALAAGGTELAHDLDSSAMNKLPAKKIVNNSANN